MFPIVVASAAVMALMPATALARHHNRHRHHVRVHHRQLGSDPAPTTAPTMFVAGFDSRTNILQISANGGTVSGTVTPNTRLVCISPQVTGMEPTGEDQSQHQAGDLGAGNGSGDNGGGDRGLGAGQGPGDDESNQMCTTANLVTNTQVRFADLSVSSAGTNWDVVVLVTQPSTTPTVPDADNDGD
jgi:hypothetical protein